MDDRTADRGDSAGLLPLGVGRAVLGPGGDEARLDGASPTRFTRIVPLDGLLESAAQPGSVPVAVVLTGLGRRGWKAVDSPSTAQAIAARADAVVLITDAEHVRTVAGLASRLVDRGVRCWVAVDAGAGYARPAAAVSALGWGLTPS